MNLEQQLRTTADAWMGEEALSLERAERLERLVRRAARRRKVWRLGAAAAAAAGIVAAGNRPVGVSGGGGAPQVGPFISRMAHWDRGAEWAAEKGYVVPVDKSVTDKGYTFRVDSVAADASRTIVYFTIEGPELTMSSEPEDIVATFNRRPAPRDGFGSMRWDVVDGRLVGQVNLAPLPHPTALVGIAPRDINGVKGDWEISFMASRTELDELTRTVEVNQRLQGEGYDITVQRVLLAPTETRVEMTGSAADNFDLGMVDLLADGVLVPHHGGGVSRHGVYPSTEVYPMGFDLPFERIDDDTNALTVRLTGLKYWHDGGPVIDLTKPGSAVEFGGVTLSLESVVVGGGQTVISLAIPGDQAAKDRAWADFREWVLVDASGQEYRAYRAEGAYESAPMKFSFTGEIAAPVRLEARYHAKRAADAVEVSIPLK